MYRFLVSVFLASALAVVVGCGSKPKLVAVRGKITQGAKAVTGGSVWFHPEGSNEGNSERMSGLLQSDGTFTARTFPHGDGIPPGKYRVTLSPDLAARTGAPRYGDLGKTPWSVKVDEMGLTDLILEIK